VLTTLGACAGTSLGACEGDALGASEGDTLGACEGADVSPGRVGLAVLGASDGTTLRGEGRTRHLRMSGAGSTPFFARSTSSAVTGGAAVTARACPPPAQRSKKSRIVG
jgi:hypothetical protein